MVSASSKRGMSAHKKQKSQFKWHKKPVPFFGRVINALRRVGPGNVITSVVATIGLWAIARPVIHVDPFRQFNPATPFSEGFKVSNDGNLAIHNLTFDCIPLDLSLVEECQNQALGHPWVSVPIPTDGYMKARGYGIDSVDGQRQTDAGNRESFHAHPDR
jgi:hypothetical protein